MFGSGVFLAKPDASLKDISLEHLSTDKEKVLNHMDILAERGYYILPTAIENPSASLASQFIQDKV